MSYLEYQKRQYDQARLIPKAPVPFKVVVTPRQASNGLTYFVHVERTDRPAGTWRPTASHGYLSLVNRNSVDEANAEAYSLAAFFGVDFTPCQEVVDTATVRRVVDVGPCFGEVTHKLIRQAKYYEYLRDSSLFDSSGQSPVPTQAAYNDGTYIGSRPIVGGELDTVMESMLRAKENRMSDQKEPAAVATSAVSDDKGLTADQLDDKYNPNGDGCHPVFGKEGWIGDVLSENTLLGYWEWVVQQVDDAD